MLNAAVIFTRLTVGSNEFWRPIDHPGERSPNRRVSPVSEDVLRNGTMHYGLEPSPVQGGEQYTGITVAHVGFSSGRLGQPTHDGFNHAAGTVTATREPHRVVALVVSDVEEGLSARFVIASEMSVRSEALRVENDLRRPVRVQRSGQRRHSLSNFRRHARSRRDYATSGHQHLFGVIKATSYSLSTRARACRGRAVCFRGNSGHRDLTASCPVVTHSVIF